MCKFDDTTPVDMTEITDDKIQILVGTQRLEYFREKLSFDKINKFQTILKMFKFK